MNTAIQKLKLKSVFSYEHGHTEALIIEDVDVIGRCTQNLKIKIQLKAIILPCIFIR